MKANERILVVDDDRDFLGIIRQILEKKGYEVNDRPFGRRGVGAAERAVL